MNDHRVVNGEKVFLTDEEQKLKDEHEATWKPEPKPVNKKEEAMLDLLAEATGKTRKQVDDLLKDK